MRFAAISMSFVLLTSLSFGYVAPLAPVRHLDCATKNAVRFDQGATTQGKPGGPTAFVKMVATGSDPNGSDSRSCDVQVVLHVRAADQTEKEIPLGQSANADFDIVDWFPRHDLILVSSERWTDVFSAPVVVVYDALNGTHRSIDVGSLFVSKGWVRCAAIIETSGFTEDGRIAVTGGPGSMQDRPKDCVARESYWAFDLRKRELQQLPAGFQQKRYGKVVSPEYRPCKEDPGIVDSCFKIHGRVFSSNGTPSLRIWRVGTDRILGVFDPEDEIIPDNLSKRLTGENVEVYGDYAVCPFTKAKPDEMQMVCVESASHLVTKSH